MSTFFNSVGYELQNAWEPTGNSQKLTAAELKAVKRAIVRDNTILDNETGEPVVIKNVVFMLAGAKPISFKLSPYNEQFKNGTQINPSSVVIDEFTNQDGELKYTVTCDAV